MARSRFRSYLGHLQFDPKLANTLLAKYLSNPRLVLLLILLVSLTGIASLFSIPRVLNPNVNIPIVIVSTVFPGAGPKDVESLLTIPIENAVSGVQNIDTVMSFSQDSSSTVEIQFTSGVDPDKARTDVQSTVDQITGLPSDAKSPKVEKVDFQNTPVWQFVITGNTDEGSLDNFAKSLRDKLKNVPSIKSVNTSGLVDEEIQVLIKPTAMTQYNINPLQLSQLISASVKSFPAGSVKTDQDTFSLSIDPAVTTVDDVRNLYININGTSVPLSDVAVISLRAKPDQPQSFFASSSKFPRKGISFSVFKTSAVSIDQAVTDAEKVVHDSLAEYPNTFSVNDVINVGDQINKQFSDLYRDFTITVLLVFVTLFIFLGIRQAIVALFAMPLTFFVTFTVMNLTNIPLSFIAVFSLLLSLGLLVDDTIVVISAMTMYFRTGKFTPVQTGLLVWRDFILAIGTTTITTVWAFLPLLLATGIIGEFIKAIPIVVSSSLIASFFVAMLITLPVLVVLLRGYFPMRIKIFLKIVVLLVLVGLLLFILPKGPLFILEILAVIIFLLVTQRVRLAMVQRGQAILERRNIPNASRQVEHETFFSTYFSNGIIHFERIAVRYRSAMRQILQSRSARRRIIIMVVIFSLFSYILLPLGFVRNEFFPSSNGDYVYLTLQLPSGTNLNVTTQKSLALLKQLRNTPDVSYVTADIGQSNNGQGFGGGGSMGNNQTLFSFVMVPENQRKLGSIKVAQWLRDNYASKYPSGQLTVAEESNGPPAGADVQIKLYGDDLTKLDEYANRVEQFLHTQKAVTDIDKSIKPGTSKLVFVPDQSKLAANNLTPDTVGLWLRLFASGNKADSLNLSGNTTTSYDITVRLNPSMSDAQAINAIAIPVPSGTSVPLSSLGHLSLVANPTLISREKGKRTISVSASVAPGYSVSQANANLENFATNDLHLADGYSWSTGGVNEENQKSITSILEAMLLSFLLIIITMVVQFGSFRKALIVMLVIPLSISGVFILFALTHTPLSFPALIGVLALFGIVVKNAILVVDKINQNTRIGMDFIDAIVDGASSRLEAIALTSFATIVGLIPITLSNALWQGLGGAIIAGLAFSGTIMLFFIPIVYYYWFRGQYYSKPLRKNDRK